MRKIEGPRKFPGESINPAGFLFFKKLSKNFSEKNWKHPKKLLKNKGRAILKLRIFRLPFLLVIESMVEDFFPSQFSRFIFLKFSYHQM